MYTHYLTHYYYYYYYGETVIHLSYRHIDVLTADCLTCICDVLLSGDKTNASVFLSKHAPVLCGVSDGGDELHSFGVVVDLSVQSQIPLDKVTRGHEPLPIFVCYAGILREGHKQKTSTTAVAGS